MRCWNRVQAPTLLHVTWQVAPVDAQLEATREGQQGPDHGPELAGRLRGEIVRGPRVHACRCFEVAHQDAVWHNLPLGLRRHEGRQRDLQDDRARYDQAQQRLVAFLDRDLVRAVADVTGRPRVRHDTDRRWMLGVEPLRSVVPLAGNSLRVHSEPWQGVHPPLDSTLEGRTSRQGTHSRRGVYLPMHQVGLNPSTRAQCHGVKIRACVARGFVSFSPPGSGRPIGSCRDCSSSNQGQGGFGGVIAARVVPHGTAPKVALLEHGCVLGRSPSQRSEVSQAGPERLER
mmetsp:Transcript_120637/g.300957  ORF Transcript_120637/g.300957 Transcript_120637/m.300957 type:complete len:287 (+) Transcript_120637:987-1847(+)